MSTTEKKLPLIGLGTFIGNEADHIADPNERMQTVRNTVYSALKLGYRHIDLAENYGNLAAVGDALKLALLPETEGGLGIKRSELWLTMKADRFGQSAVESFIHTLGVDYIDTFMYHHPFSSHAFSSEEKLYHTWQKFTALPKSLVKNYGVSNCYPEHLARLMAVCEKYDLEKPFSNEVESNLLCPNQATIDFCQQHNIQVIAYSPLAYNMADAMLNGRAFGDDLQQVAQEIKATEAQTALAWHMARGVAVIPKSKNPQRLAENLAAINKINALSMANITQLSNMRFDGMTSVTSTAEDAAQHGQSLSWMVSPSETSQKTTSTLIGLDAKDKDSQNANKESTTFVPHIDTNSNINVAEQQPQNAAEQLRQLFFELHQAYKAKQNWQNFRVSGINSRMSWSEIIAHAAGQNPQNATLSFFTQFSGARTKEVLKQMEIINDNGQVINEAILAELEKMPVLLDSAPF